MGFAVARCDLKKLLIELLVGGWCLGGASPERVRLEIPRLPAEALVCDGRLDEPVWERACRVDRFWQTSPAENQSPSRRTELMIFHDGRAFHVGVRCWDDHPEAIRKERYRRDDLSASNESIVLFLDPAGTAKRALWIRVSPWGDVADGLRDYVRGIISRALDVDFKHATRIHDQGWDVELELPMASLPIPFRERGQTWNVALDRVIPRQDVEVVSLVPLRRESSDPKDQFVEGHLAQWTAVAGKAWHFLPTLVGTWSRVRTDDAGVKTSTFERKGRAELTGWWSPDPSLRAMFTVRPDFSQVEADDVYQRINNRYPVYIAEKRPFFLDPNDPFRTHFRLVHTRSIVDPEVGLQFSGIWDRLGLFALGALEKDTPSERFGGTDSQLRDTAWGVGAGRYEGAWGSFGLLGTSMDHGDMFNRVLSAEANPRFGNLDLGIQVVQSWTRLQEAKVSTGYGVFFKAEQKVNRWLSVQVAHESLSRDFQALAGFMPEVGIHENSIASTFTYQPSSYDVLIKGYVLNARASRKLEQGGGLRQALLQLDQGLVLPGQLYVNLHGAWGSEVFAGIEFPLRDVSLSLGWWRHELFGLHGYVGRGLLPRYDISNPRNVYQDYVGGGFTHVNGSFRLEQTFTVVQLNEAMGESAARQVSSQTILEWVFGKGWSFRIFRTWDRARWYDFDMDNPNAYLQALLVYQPRTFSKIMVGYSRKTTDMRSMALGWPLSKTLEDRAFLKCVMYL